MYHNAIKKGNRLIVAFVCFLLIFSCSPTYAATKKLKIRETKITVEEGKKYSIKTNISCTFKTSKKSIATVSKKGVVTAKKAGKAKITVTTKNKKQRKIIKITVVKKATKKVAVTTQEVTTTQVPTTQAPATEAPATTQLIPPVTTQKPATTTQEATTTQVPTTQVPATTTQEAVTTQKPATTTQVATTTEVVSVTPPPVEIGDLTAVYEGKTAVFAEAFDYTKVKVKYKGELVDIHDCTVTPDQNNSINSTWRGFGGKILYRRCVIYKVGTNSYTVKYKDCETKLLVEAIELPEEKVVYRFTKGDMQTVKDFNDIDQSKIIVEETIGGITQERKAEDIQFVDKTNCILDGGKMAYCSWAYQVENEDYEFLADMYFDVLLESESN